MDGLLKTLCQTNRIYNISGLKNTRNCTKTTVSGVLFRNLFCWHTEAYRTCYIGKFIVCKVSFGYNFWICFVANHKCVAVKLGVYKAGCVVLAVVLWIILSITIVKEAMTKFFPEIL